MTTQSRTLEEVLSDTNMATANPIVDIRTVLIDRERWTQNKLACDEHSAKMRYDDARACRWCLQGAIFRFVAKDAQLRTECILTDVMHDVLPEDSHCTPTLVSFNDFMGHDGIMTLLNAAVDRLPEGE